jgi:environmental stress-induced protein Ves
VQIFRKSSFVATPWKNGGGITHEAIRVPPGTGPFLWRVSIAHIEAAGAFSDFAGYQRKMLLLRGAGVALSFSNGERRVLRRIGELAEFDGALSTSCELLDGACVDLNLIVANSVGAVPVRVENLIAPLQVAASCHESLLVACIQGTILVEGDAGERAVLEPWDLALLAHAPDCHSRLARAESCAEALAFIATIRR